MRLVFRSTVPICASVQLVQLHTMFKFNKFLKKTSTFKFFHSYLLSMCVLDGPVIEQQQHGGETAAAGQLLSLRPLHAAQDQALGGTPLPSTRGLSIIALH
jgi:hypothetical protein